MGASMSTLGGWTIIFCVVGYYAFRYLDEGKRREAARAAVHRQRIDDRQSVQGRKENKDKVKRQRGEVFSKGVEESDKTAKPKPRTQKPSTPLSTATNQKADYSTDDGVNNREFARQLASIKLGTNFNGPKKDDEKRQKSVKQSQALEREDNLDVGVVSAPSSTAGVDADDDQSPLASPEVTAVDAGDVSDMLESPAPGLSVLRLTDTDKVKQKEKKSKTPEKGETKKQRQNKQKAEAAKLAREEAEQERKVKLEAQRRLARISEGRPAKDGSTFTAAQAKPSVWTSNSANGGSSSGTSNNGNYLPVQPLDTFDTPYETAHQTNATKSPVPSVGKTNGWISSLPSEEEQMEMLREEEAWSTVKTKKATKGKRKDVTTDSNDDSAAASTVTKPQQVAPVTPAPVVTKAQTANSDGNRPTKSFTQQSSFAALSADNEEPEVEEEWDV